ncbi:MAG: flagellar basal body-associated protein FliL [Pararobbsia sp.]
MATTTSPTDMPRKNGKKTLIIILAAVLVLAAAGGGAAFWMLSRRDTPAHHTPVVVTPVFFTLEPFTVNLLSDDAQRYVHVGLTLRLANAESEAALNDHMPEVRSRILLLLSNKHPEDLSSLEGKQKLAQEIKTACNQPFSNGAPPNRIADVLFTDFVVQ